MNAETREATRSPPSTRRGSGRSRPLVRRRVEAIQLDHLDSEFGLGKQETWSLPNSQTAPGSRAR